MAKKCNRVPTNEEVNRLAPPSASPSTFLKFKSPARLPQDDSAPSGSPRRRVGGGVNLFLSKPPSILNILLCSGPHWEVPPCRGPDSDRPLFCLSSRQGVLSAPALFHILLARLRPDPLSYYPAHSLLPRILLRPPFGVEPSRGIPDTGYPLSLLPPLPNPDFPGSAVAISPAPPRGTPPVSVSALPL